MARAQGARSQLAAAFEITYGTAPASGFMQMPFASASLGAEQPLLASELLGYGRDPLSVAWARVWLGIHWPLDMLGSMVVAGGAVWTIALVRNTRGINRVTTFALNVFDRLLDLARIPPAWVHRSGKAQ